MSQNLEAVRDTIVLSPLGVLLGLQVDAIEPDRARVRLPFRPEVTTLPEIVHGGAISALIDTAATAAAWSGVDLAKNPRGTTIALTVNFIAAGKGEDLVADARVVQRGGTITALEVAVTGASGKTVARGLVTYKLSTDAKR